MKHNMYNGFFDRHQPKAIETESENEAAILLSESLEHRQRTPEEDTLLELLIILIEKFEETTYPLPNLKSDRMLLHLMEARGMKQEELVGLIGSRGVVHDDLLLVLKLFGLYPLILMSKQLPLRQERDPQFLPINLSYDRDGKLLLVA